MRTRTGAHLAGLLAAAGAPLSASDLARLIGRSVAKVTALLPAASTPDIAVGAASWELRGDDARARVVRNLHVGPLADGAERKTRVRERALAPFRSALDAAIWAARIEWGWDRAPEYALSQDFAVRMLSRRSERRAAVRLLTDARRARTLESRHPDAARDQLWAGAAVVAASARSARDLEDLAALLIAASRLDAGDGAVPRRLAPVVALLGDTERAVALARGVRTDVAIELAYVARAAAAIGDARADEIVTDALVQIGPAGPDGPDAGAGAVAAAVAAAGASAVAAAVAAAGAGAAIDAGVAATAVVPAGSAAPDAPVGALLRTAQAVAGTALYLSPESALARAGQARALIERAFAAPPGPTSVEGLRSRQFRSAREHEQVLAATTYATIAVACAQAGDHRGAVAAARDARTQLAAVADAAHRAVGLADTAARLAVRTAECSRWSALVLDSVAGDAAVDALATTDDVAALAAIARLLAGGAERDGDNAEPPAVADLEHATLAAGRALDRIAADDAIPPRGALLSAARVVSPDAPLAVRAARGTFERARTAHHASSLERRTRARGESVALAEAAAVFDAAGVEATARAAAHAARDAVSRVPAAARARPIAEVAAVLLGARDADVRAVAEAAAREERAGTNGRWDAAAPALLVAAVLRIEPRERSPAQREILDTGILDLRRGEHAPSLTMLADLAARHGDAVRAAELVEHALRAAHVRDPLRRERALTAVRDARAVLSGTGRGASSGAAHDPAPGDEAAPAALSIDDTARAWLHAGYPIAGLPALAAAHPAAAERIAAAVRRDLEV